MKVNTTRIIRQEVNHRQLEFPFSSVQYFYLCRGLVVCVRFWKIAPFSFDVWLDGRYSVELSSSTLEFPSLSRAMNYACCRLLSYGYNLDELRLEAIRQRAEEDIDNCKTQKIRV